MINVSYLQQFLTVSVAAGSMPLAPVLLSVNPKHAVSPICEPAGLALKV